MTSSVLLIFSSKSFDLCPNIFDSHFLLCLCIYSSFYSVLLLFLTIYLLYFIIISSFFLIPFIVCSLLFLHSITASMEIEPKANEHSVKRKQEWVQHGNWISCSYFTFIFSIFFTFIFFNFCFHFDVLFFERWMCAFCIFVELFNFSHIKLKKNSVCFLKSCFIRFCFDSIPFLHYCVCCMYIWERTRSWK